MNRRIASGFILFGLLALCLGLLAGLLATVQIMWPPFLKPFLGFHQIRPLHVSCMVGWIVLVATGSVYAFGIRKQGLPRWAQRTAWVHLALFSVAAILIVFSYLGAFMGGREYLTFPPVLIIPILLGWGCFGFVFFKNRREKSPVPVYVWMWGTGIVFMVYHLIEAYLWVVPQIRILFIRDITVQWKAYGSFVGSWNMLVYGLAIYMMTRVKGDSKIAHSREAFFFYFLGLCNLMFGWAHHTYVIPTAPWIRVVAYVVSMTEWIVLFHLISGFIKTVSNEEVGAFRPVIRFLKAADIWIAMNLLMALGMSIPALHIFTHGTYITVAHAMGSTIGINTSILMGALFLLAIDLKPSEKKLHLKGFWLFNLSLAGFWLALISAGLIKVISVAKEPEILFSQLHQAMTPSYHSMALFGVGIMLAIFRIIWPLFSIFFHTFRATEVNSEEA